MMKACVFDRHGDASVLTVREVPKPTIIPPGNVLVKVHAAAMNPADYLTRSGAQAGLMHFRWPRVLGFDFSGTIELVPSNTETDLKVGEEVFGMIRSLPQPDRGTCAEYVVVEAEVCVRKPTNISHEEAASMPLTFITAVCALRKCGLSETAPTDGQPGPRVLVLGGAGGVGVAAIQLAKSMFHASFVATTASAGPKTEVVQSIGADQVVDYRTQRFYEVLASADESKLFDAIVDCTEEAKRCVRLLRRGGCVTTIGMPPTAEGLRNWVEQGLYKDETKKFPRAVMTSRFGGWLIEHISGASSLRSRCAARGARFDFVVAVSRADALQPVADLAAAGKVRAVIERTFPLAQCAEACTLVEGRHVAGKVVVRVVEGQ